MHARAGVVWNTLAAIGSNFDLDGFYNLRRLSWPSDFKGTTLDELAAQQFYGRGSREAFHDLFSCSDGVASDGNEWASLKSLNIAHKHFREIKETGMLGIFPFHLQDSVVQVSECLRAQGTDLSIPLPWHASVDYKTSFWS